MGIHRKKTLEPIDREMDEMLRELEQWSRKAAKLEAVNRRMAKFVPSAVVESIEGRNSETLEKKTRDVTILMLDISGCTVLCEKLSHEDMNDIIERFFSAFLDDIHRNHGDVNEIMGDGLMAIFQGRGEVANALNAARSALDILEATNRINSELSGKFEPIVIKMGISSGAAAVGVTRFAGLSGERWTYTASGPVANLASRLCSAPKNGAALVDGATAKRVGGLIDLVDLGKMVFKNVATPVKVYMIVENRSSSQMSPHEDFDREGAT